MKAIICFGLGLSLMLGACAGKGADPGPPPTVGTEMGAGNLNPPGTAPPVAAMPPAADPKAQCDQLKAEYFAKLNAAPGTCTTDADCTNVPGGIDDCGRVVDAKTARAIAPLFEKYVKLCGTNINPRVGGNRARPPVAPIPVDPAGFQGDHASGSGPFTFPPDKSVTVLGCGPARGQRLSERRRRHGLLQCGVGRLILESIRTVGRRDDCV